MSHRPIVVFDEMSRRRNGFRPNVVHPYVRRSGGVGGGWGAGGGREAQVYLKQRWGSTLFHISLCLKHYKTPLRSKIQKSVLSICKTFNLSRRLSSLKFVPTKMIKREADNVLHTCINYLAYTNILLLKTHIAWS